MKKTEKFIGQTIKRLKIIKQKENKYYVHCQCGNKKWVNAYDVIRGKIQSCGCYTKELSSKIHKIHGMKGTRFYRIWQCMQTRVYNKNRKEYKNYGGRGIMVLWKSHKEFKNDMYESYLNHVKNFGEKNTTIDRVDNDENYCKENCRWATYKEQGCNTRMNKKILYNNKIYLVPRLSEMLKIKKSTLYCAYYRAKKKNNKLFNCQNYVFKII